jgi:hypothetical protein
LQDAAVNRAWTSITKVWKKKKERGTFAECAENHMVPVTAKKWICEVRNGMAGYSCTGCGTWKHASEFLVCTKCDEEKEYIITGPVLNDEQTYWNNDNGWVSEFSEATTFPREIVTTLLPQGATGIMELTLAGEYVRYLQTLPRGGS